VTYTIEQYTALKAAYATGALSVKYDDQQITYRSRDEMAAILREMERELFPSSAGSKTKTPTFSKGL
jgi:hypothetical protein